MKHYKNRKHTNQIEQEILLQKLAQADEELENAKWAKDNADFVCDIAMKERDRATLTCKFLTHLLIVMDALEGSIADDYPLSDIIGKAIKAFKAKINDGMLCIKYDRNGIWYDGSIDNDDETDLDNDKEM